MEVRALRKMLGLRGWRRLHTEQLHNLYFLPDIIEVTKSKRIRWAGNVARMWELEVLTGSWF